MINVAPTPAPRMIRMLSGKMFPAASAMGRPITKIKRMLVVLQYYEGDKDAAEQLALLIADLERTRNKEADILLVNRADCREVKRVVVDKLEAKFDKVMLHRCRRSDAKGYPWATNSMFFDLVALMTERPWCDEYFAFVNLEPDCVPLRRGWISELISEIKSAMQLGKGAVGFIHDNPATHMNGLAVWSSDILNRVGRRILNGGNAKYCYDVYHAPSILPHCVATNLIHFEYRRPTITAEELFAPYNGAQPVLFHGIKDDSARVAVRQRLLTVAPKEKAARPPVYTYFHDLTAATPEDKAIIANWRAGWTSLGWTCAVLTLREAARHPKFPQFTAAIAKLPHVGDGDGHQNRFYRWLALAAVGGGIMVDYDVLPVSLTAMTLDANTPAIVLPDGDALMGLALHESSADGWVDRIIAYDPQPADLLLDRAHVTDTAIAAAHFPNRDSNASGQLRHFSKGAVGNVRKSEAMAAFLRGET